MGYLDCCPECGEEWYTESESTGPDSSTIHLKGHRFTDSFDKIVCEGCGSKFKSVSESRDCPICAGTGTFVDEGYDPSMDAYFEERQSCLRCDGDGELEPLEVDYIYKVSE